MQLNVSTTFDDPSLKPVNGPTKHELSFNRDTLPKRQRPWAQRLESDEQYNTVSSYPPASLSNSMVSLRSIAKGQDADQSLEPPIESYEEPKSPHSVVEGPIHTFVVETVPEPAPRTLLTQTSYSKFEIPKISIESDITTQANEDTMTSFKSSADDENYSNSSINSGTIMTNGGHNFQKKISPPRSPPQSRSILVPDVRYDLKQKLQRQLTVEEGTDSSAESDDGFVSGSNSSVIQDSLSPPIDRHARKEGVISDQTDTKDFKVVTYEKDERYRLDFVF